MARIIKIFMAISRGIDDHLLSIALTLSYTQEGQVCLKVKDLFWGTFWMASPDLL